MAVLFSSSRSSLWKKKCLIEPEDACYCPRSRPIPIHPGWHWHRNTGWTLQLARTSATVLLVCSRRDGPRGTAAFGPSSPRTRRPSMPLGAGWVHAAAVQGEIAGVPAAPRCFRALGVGRPSSCSQSHERVGDGSPTPCPPPPGRAKAERGTEAGRQKAPAAARRGAVCVCSLLLPPEAFPSSSPSRDQA